MTLPYGWVRRPSGDIWDGADRHARPVAYKLLSGGWMVAGVRSAEELQAIADLASGKDQGDG